MKRLITKPTLDGVPLANPSFDLALIVLNRNMRKLLKKYKVLETYGMDENYFSHCFVLKL